MTPTTEEDIKISLSKDLIVFLFKIITFERSRVESSELVHKLVRSWSEKIDEELTSYKEHTVTELSKLEMYEDSEDVLSILYDINTSCSGLVKTAFINEMLEILRKSVVEIKS
jgi:hypothetical protein